MVLRDLFNLGKQLRSVIEWENPSDDLVIASWSESFDEIKDASKLVIKPGEGVILLYQGAIQAVYTKEGLYQIDSDNIPFITTLKKVLQNFESEHKVGVYFFRTAQLLNQKWGTSTSIKYADPVYQFPVGLRAYGNFSFRLADPNYFFLSVLGARSRVTVQDIRAVLVPRFIQPLTATLAHAGYAYLEIDKHREELAVQCSEKAKSDFATLGFELIDFRIEGTDFDEETTARVATIADTIAETGAAKAAGLTFAQMQQVKAMRDAAKNEGGGAGVGMSIGAGVALGQQMADMFTQPSGAVPTTAQSPAAGPQPSVAERLTTLEDLRRQGLISQEEYTAKRGAILDEI
jgi:membrane protease subunit (stomatin/prohibitin family)